jgi:LDH2 family malate/lactate/ureidoglycolate dehydrogenase
MLDTPDYPHDSRQDVVVPADGLRTLLAEMFVRKGMFAVDAETAADRLVEADLRGIHSHGSRAVWRYLEAMDAGDIDPRAEVTTERETAAMAVLNGGMGLGHVAATKGMKLAIRKAREVGTGTVAVRRSQHFGAAGVYALMAAREEMIGYCTTNTGPATVAAYGSRAPATANNAFAWGVPVRSGPAPDGCAGPHASSGPPFILDMAVAVSSWGKVESFKMYGRELPAGWALDEHGNPTTDAQAAKTLLPASGARGYGLSFVSSILAGPLVGGRMPIHKTWSVAADGSEHFFYAIDVKQFVELETFFQEVAAAIADIRALQPADGFDRVRLPGELEHERAERWLRDGIPIHPEHAKKLEEVATAMKLPVPW